MNIDEEALNQIDEKHVIEIQRIWRGYRTRLFVTLLKKATKLKKKYFLEEEYWETVSSTDNFPVSQISSILRSTGS